MVLSGSYLDELLAARPFPKGLNPVAPGLPSPYFPGREPGAPSVPTPPLPTLGGGSTLRIVVLVAVLVLVILGTGAIRKPAVTRA